MTFSKSIASEKYVIATPGSIKPGRSNLVGLPDCFFAPLLAMTSYLSVLAQENAGHASAAGDVHDLAVGRAAQNRQP